MPLPPDIHDLAQKIIAAYVAEKKKIVTAESCTGGLIATTLTDIPGASSVVERGFVTYSNEAKVEVLGVPPDLLEAHGAVSAEVAEAMAVGALEFSRAHVGVAVTGIAGPSGGTLSKPIGLVFLGLATRAGVAFHSQCQFKGDRGDIRMQALREALTLLSMQVGN
jgi:nicotinamide-nucleotide amidase